MNKALKDLNEALEPFGLTAELFRPSPYVLDLNLMHGKTLLAIYCGYTPEECVQAFIRSEGDHGFTYTFMDGTTLPTFQSVNELKMKGQLLHISENCT